MSRPLRIEFAGALYHITSRGDRREDIYLDDADRERFLEVFAEVCDRHRWVCHAYCLMSNHYHLLVETRAATLGAVGRLTEIDHPSGGTVSWLPTLFTYDYVTTSERGIAANHWRRTVSTGNARAVTYFDAQLHPILADSYATTDSGSHSNTHTAYDWRGQAIRQAYAVAGTPSVPSESTCQSYPTTTLCQGTRTSYDALGRAIQVDQDSELGTLTTTTQYLSGAQVKVVAPKGGAS